MTPRKEAHAVRNQRLTRRDVLRAGAITCALAAVDGGVVFGRSRSLIAQGSRPSSWKKTVVVSQETGKSDAEGMPATNDTTRWGAPGTDMGCPVEFKGKLYLLFGDVPSFPGDTNIADADPICYTTETTVKRRGIGFSCLAKPSGAFRPLTIAGYGALGTVETPTGAFAYGGQLYAFVVRGGDKPYSTLISTADPNLDFTAHYDISSPSGKFWQIAPWVIRNRDCPGVPSTSGEGLLLWGQRGTSIYLGWMPLSRGVHPPRGLRYYAGRARWSENEADAVVLFPTQGTTQLSVTWLAGPRRWICLYTRASVEHPHESVVARVGTDPWSWSEEMVIFNPDRDAAWGRYMHLPGADRLDKVPPNTNPERVPGYAYSPYVLNRFTSWESKSRTIKIYYLMATFVPYQVLLMRSELNF